MESGVQKQVVKMSLEHKTDQFNSNDSSDLQQQLQQQQQQHADHSHHHHCPNHLLHENAHQPASCCSDEEDSDLENELEAEGLLLGRELQTKTQASSLVDGVVFLRGDYPRSPDRARQVYDAETTRYDLDLVSPYKRLRLEDLTQSSMESSQAAGEGEAHSLLKSCDDDDFNGEEKHREVASDDDLHNGDEKHGELICDSARSHRYCPNEKSSYNSVNEVFDGTTSYSSESKDNSAQSFQSANGQIGQSMNIPDQPDNNFIVPSENKTLTKKKKSFFNNLFGKSAAWRSRDTTKNELKLYKTPLKDVRNIAWAQTHNQHHESDMSLNICADAVFKTPAGVKTSSTSTPMMNMLSPQEMRASIPYIDELCMEEDPFISSDEREFPPPPALDKDKRSYPTRAEPVQDSNPSSVELYSPDYQTLETRQISIEPARYICKEVDDNKDVLQDARPVEIDDNIYDEIAGEDIENDEDCGDSHAKSGNSGKYIPSSIANEKVPIISSAMNSSSVGITHEQDTSSMSTKSAKSVGTSCVNIPASLLHTPSSLEGAHIHNMAAPSESSAMTTQTYKGHTSDDVCAVYDSVDSASEAGNCEDYQNFTSISKSKIGGDGSNCDVNQSSNCSSRSALSIHRPTITKDVGGGAEVNESKTSETKVTMSSGVSTQGLWDGQEVNTGSRYISEQELPVKSRSFESAFDSKPSSAVNLHHPARYFSMQALPTHSYHHQHQRQHHPQHPDEFQRHQISRISTESIPKTHASNPHLPASVFPHHHLDVVLENPTPREEEDFDLPSGASARDFLKTLSPSKQQTASLAREYPPLANISDPRSSRNNGIFTSSEDPHNPPSMGYLISDLPYGGNDDFVPFSENPEHNGHFEKRGSMQETTEEQFPYYLDQEQNFSSEDSLQQYLHQVEVEKYLRHHRELARLQHDIENSGVNTVNTNTDTIINTKDRSKTATYGSQRLQLQPQPLSTGSLMSRQSSGISRKSGESERMKKTVSSSSSGSLKQQQLQEKDKSSGSIQGNVQGRSSMSSSQHVQWSSGQSVHHQSRNSSQGSTDRSNQGPSRGSTSSKKAVLQSSGHLKLSAYWNVGLLTVHVIQARCLSSAWNTDCDSYVKMSLVPDDSRRSRCKTSMVRACNSPVFDEKFSLEILEEDRKKRLLISMWHKDSDTG